MQHALEAAGVEFLDGEEPGVQSGRAVPEAIRLRLYRSRI
jgi:hypothetical protein